MLSKYNEALQLCIHIIDMNPTDQDTICLIATIYCRMKDFEQGLTLLEHGLTLNPNHAKSFILQSCIYIEMQSFSLALQSIEKAIHKVKENSTKSVAWCLKGSLLLISEMNYSTSMKYWERALDLDPNNLVARLEIESALVGNKLFEMAIPVLES